MRVLLVYALDRLGRLLPPSLPNRPFLDNHGWSILLGMMILSGGGTKIFDIEMTELSVLESDLREVHRSDRQSSLAADKTFGDASIDSRECEMPERGALDYTDVDKIINTCSHALVIGVGGGGDVVGALAIARILEGSGVRCTLGGLSWEQPTIDPEPGQRSLKQVVDVDVLHERTWLARASSLAEPSLNCARRR